MAELPDMSHAFHKGGELKNFAMIFLSELLH